MLTLPVYLDYNATTPVDKRVLEVMLPYFTTQFGNAASNNHIFGWQAAEAVEYARENVAALIHANPQEIVFTSGATEAINLALKGIFEMYANKGNHIITCAAEHKAVLDTCKHIENLGGVVTYLPVNKEGFIDVNNLEKSLQPNTILISIMYANNETGVIQPIKTISEIAHRHKVLFFTDAAQAAGKTKVDVNEDGIDLMAFSAHKLYGPKGIGALYVRRKNPRVTLAAQIDGGAHEKGMRSGTLNVPGIVGFGKACEICIEEMQNDNTQISALRNKLEKNLLQLPGSFINGNTVHRLPNTANICFSRAEKNELLNALNKKIAASSGSACTSALPQPSHVLKALGLSNSEAGSSVRFSLGRFTTEEEIELALEYIAEVVNKIKAIQQHA